MSVSLHDRAADLELAGLGWYTRRFQRQLRRMSRDELVAFIVVELLTHQGEDVDGWAYLNARHDPLMVATATRVARSWGLIDHDRRELHDRRLVR